MKRITVYILEPGDRPFFKLEWVLPGTTTRKSRSTRTTDLREAERQRDDLEYELNHGLHQEPGKLTWQRFRGVFEAEYLAGLRARTREHYGTCFDVLEQECSPGLLGDVNERMLARWVARLGKRQHHGGKVGLAPHSVRSYLIDLKHALAWAVEQKFLHALPRFPRVKVPRKRPQPIPASDFEKLLQAAREESMRTYLLCAWYAGLRLEEAHQLRWERSERFPWLDPARERIWLPAAFVKADIDQWVPVHPILLQALDALPRTGPEVFMLRSRSGGPLSRTALTARVLRLAHKAGVKLSMHRLRKGFGCRVAQQLGKGDAPILHTLMRHRSMQITMDYYASVDDALQAKIRELD